MIPREIQILAPWKALEPTPDRAPGFYEAELQRELSPGHVLCGAKVAAIALRVDRDDVLFEVQDAMIPLAVVHLTWQKESSALWPVARLYQSWEQWVRDEMNPAHEDYSR